MTEDVIAAIVVTIGMVLCVACPVAMFPRLRAWLRDRATLRCFFGHQWGVVRSDQAAVLDGFICGRRLGRTYCLHCVRCGRETEHFWEGKDPFEFEAPFYPPPTGTRLI